MIENKQPIKILVPEVNNKTLQHAILKLNQTNITAHDLTT